MKKLMIALLLFTGCASVPYSIEMVNVGDEIEYQRPSEDLKGCVMKIANIETLRYDCATNSVQPRLMLKEGPQSIICGEFTCKEKTEKWACFTFEAFRLDRPTPRENFREGSRR